MEEPPAGEAAPTRADGNRRRRAAVAAACSLVVASLVGLTLGSATDGGDERARPQARDSAPGVPAPDCLEAAAGCGAADGQLVASAGSSTTTGQSTGASRRATGGGAGRAGAATATPTAGRPTTSTTSSTGPTQPTTTTTTSGDTSPPRISQLQAGGELPDGPDEIFEGVDCGATELPVEAAVFDASGIQSATLYWDFVGAHGRVAGKTVMHQSLGKYRATFGPFPAGTVPPGASVVITWWVEANDTAGNTGRADAPAEPVDERITLSSCPG